MHTDFDPTPNTNTQEDTRITPATPTPNTQEDTATLEAAAPSDVRIGVVSGCTKLNVRKIPEIGAEILSVIPRAAEVMIDEGESTDEFYKVCTSSGVDGFCMKKYIAVHL